MAENSWFNNSNLFTNVDDTTHDDINANNESEVLATQGNVINSIKVFWNKLRRKLVHAITRDDTSEAVGGIYQPIFVNENGGVQVCEPTTIQKDVVQGNIRLDEITSPYSGQIVCIKATRNSNTSDSSDLTIKNNPVFYPTGVAVKVSDVIDGIYLFTYIKEHGNKWILNNKINEVIASSKSSANGTGTGGNPGLMTADDKAKLDKIAWGANNFTYTLPTASISEKGGVKSTTTGTTTGRDYNVQVNQDGTMKVNVPWENTHNSATLCVSNTSNGTQNGAATNGNMYLKIVDGTNVSSLKISGSGSTNVTSNSNGEITIESPTVKTYNRLGNSNNDDSKDYVIKGPGEDNATINYYLAGDGSWQNGMLVPTNGSNGKILKWGQNGPYWAADTE